MRRAAAVLAFAALAACAEAPRLLLTADQSRALTLGFLGPVTADRDGSVFVLTPNNIARYDPDGHEIEELLFDRTAMSGLAAVPGGPLLVLQESRLQAVVAGRLVDIAALPGPGLLIAAREDAVYMVAAVGGEDALLKFDLAERRLSTLFLTSQRIGALAAVPGGCLVGVGGGVHRIFDPEGGEVQRRLLFAVSAPGISGLAADPDARAVYFSDGAATYRWVGGRVSTAFPVGGALALSRGTLVIADRLNRQLVSLPDPANVEEPASTTLTPPGPDRGAEVRISDLRGETRDDGLHITFTAQNGSSVWIDRLEVLVSVRTSESMVLFEQPIAIGRLLAPNRAATLDTFVSWAQLSTRGIDRSRVQRFAVAMRRATESPVGAGIRLALKKTAYVDGRMMGELEVSNDGASTLRVEAFDVEFSREKDKPTLHRARVDLSCEVGAGKTRTLELPLVTDQDFRALESRHGRLGWVSVSVARIGRTD